MVDDLWAWVPLDYDTYKGGRCDTFACQIVKRLNTLVKTNSTDLRRAISHCLDKKINNRNSIVFNYAALYPDLFFGFLKNLIAHNYCKEVVDILMYRTDENDCSGPIATQVQNDPGFYEDIYNQLPKDVRAPLDGLLPREHLLFNSRQRIV